MNTNKIQIYEESRANTLKCHLCFPIPKLKITEHETIVVMMDTFPLRSGHMLISTKAHQACLGELEAKQITEINTILDSLEKQYGTYLLYEHGRAGSCQKDGSECQHFHLHFIPMNNDRISEIKNSIRDAISPMFLQELGSFSDVVNSYWEWGDYLLFGTRSQIDIAHPMGKPIPPHFLRTLIANALGRNDRSDWSSINDPEAFIASAISLEFLGDISQ